MKTFTPTQPYTVYLNTTGISDLKEALQGVLQISTVMDNGRINFHPQLRLVQHSSNDYERANGRKILMEFVHKPIAIQTVRDFLCDFQQSEQIAFPHLNWSSSLIITVEVDSNQLVVSFDLYDMEN